MLSCRVPFLLVVCVCSLSARQQADDIKAIERAKIDLQRVQSQLLVVEEKTSAVRREHHQLTLTFQSDEMRMSSLENGLKVCTETSLPCTALSNTSRLQKLVAANPVIQHTYPIH